MQRRRFREFFQQQTGLPPVVEQSPPPLPPVAASQAPPLPPLATMAAPPLPPVRTEQAPPLPPIRTTPQAPLPPIRTTPQAPLPPIRVERPAPLPPIRVEAPPPLPDVRAPAQWTPPPGYVAPNPAYGQVPPPGGYGTTSGAATTTATGTTATTASTTTGATAAQTPAPTPVETDYYVGDPLPEGSEILQTTPEGHTAQRLPDGSVWEVSPDGVLLQRVDGGQARTDEPTILENGVVQASGHSGQVAQPAPIREQLTGTPEDIAAIEPYIAEMEARGETPDQYSAFLGERASTAQRRADQLAQDYAMAPALGMSPEEIEALRVQSEQARQEADAYRFYFDQWMSLSEATGLSAPENGGFIDTARELGSTAVGLVFLPINLVADSLKGPVGDGMYIISQSGVVNEDLYPHFAAAAQAIGESIGLGFDPNAFVIWSMDPANSELIKAAYENGYDANGDGTADFTGGRAVWELFIGQQGTLTRIMYDVVLDPTTWIPVVGPYGRALRTANRARRGVGVIDDSGEVIVRSTDDLADAGQRAIQPPGRVSTDRGLRPGTEVLSDVGPVPTRPLTRGELARSYAGEAVGTALEFPYRLFEEPADRAFSAAARGISAAAHATPGVGRLLDYSSETLARIAAGETGTSLDRATLMIRNLAEQLAANPQDLAQEAGAAGIGPDGLPRPMVGAITRGEEPVVEVTTGGPISRSRRAVDTEPISPAGTLTLGETEIRHNGVERLIGTDLYIIWRGNRSADVWRGMPGTPGAERVQIGLSGTADEVRQTVREQADQLITQIVPAEQLPDEEFFAVIQPGGGVAGNGRTRAPRIEQLAGTELFLEQPGGRGPARIWFGRPGEQGSQIVEDGLSGSIRDLRHDLRLRQAELASRGSQLRTLAQSTDPLDQDAYRRLRVQLGLSAPTPDPLERTARPTQATDQLERTERMVAESNGLVGEAPDFRLVQPGQAAIGPRQPGQPRIEQLDGTNLYIITDPGRRRGSIWYGPPEQEGSELLEQATGDLPRLRDYLRTYRDDLDATGQQLVEWRTSSDPLDREAYRQHLSEIGRATPAPDPLDRRLRPTRGDELIDRTEQVIAESEGIIREAPDFRLVREEQPAMGRYQAAQSRIEHLAGTDLYVEMPPGARRATVWSGHPGEEGSELLDQNLTGARDSIRRYVRDHRDELTTDAERLRQLRETDPEGYAALRQELGLTVPGAAPTPQLQLPEPTPIRPEPELPEPTPLRPEPEPTPAPLREEPEPQVPMPLREEPEMPEGIAPEPAATELPVVQAGPELRPPSRNELEDAFRRVASEPWSETRSLRNQLYRRGVIREKTSQAKLGANRLALKTYLELVESSYRTAMRGILYNPPGSAAYQAGLAHLNDPDFRKAVARADDIFYSYVQSTRSLKPVWQRGTTIPPRGATRVLPEKQLQDRANEIIPSDEQTLRATFAQQTERDPDLAAQLEREQATGMPDVPELPPSVPTVAENPNLTPRQARELAETQAVPEVPVAEPVPPVPQEPATSLQRPAQDQGTLPPTAPRDRTQDITTVPDEELEDEAQRLWQGDPNGDGLAAQSWNSLEAQASMARNPLPPNATDRYRTRYLAAQDALAEVERREARLTELNGEQVRRARQTGQPASVVTKYPASVPPTTMRGDWYEGRPSSRPGPNSKTIKGTLYGPEDGTQYLVHRKKGADGRSYWTYDVRPPDGRWVSDRGTARNRALRFSSERQAAFEVRKLIASRDPTLTEAEKDAFALIDEAPRETPAQARAARQQTPEPVPEPTPEPTAPETPAPEPEITQQVSEIDRRTLEMQQERVAAQAASDPGQLLARVAAEDGWQIDPRVLAAPDEIPISHPVPDVPGWRVQTIGGVGVRAISDERQARQVMRNVNDGSTLQIVNDEGHVVGTARSLNQAIDNARQHVGLPPLSSVAPEPTPRVQTVRTPLGDQAVLPFTQEARRPTFGQGQGPLQAGTEHTPPPPLTLQPQVLDTPEAQRQAERLRGQTDMFGEALDTPAPPPAPSPTTPERAPYTYINEAEIITDEKRFQPRRETTGKPQGLDLERVERYAANWNPAILDPLRVWRDPKDGKVYLLSGHHRLAAARKVGQRELPVVFFEGTEREARRAARLSNSQAAGLTDSETARSFRQSYEDALAEGLSEQEAYRIAIEDHPGITRNRANYFNAGWLPDSLLDELDSSGSRLTLPQAAVLGEWIRDGRLTATDIQAFYYREMTQRNFTKAELQEGLAELYRQAQQQNMTIMDMFSGLEQTGNGNVSVMDEIKKITDARKKLKTQIDQLEAVRGMEGTTPQTQQNLEKLRDDAARRLAELEVELGRKTGSIFDLRSGINLTPYIERAIRETRRWLNEPAEAATAARDAMIAERAEGMARAYAERYPRRMELGEPAVPRMTAEGFAGPPSPEAAGDLVNPTLYIPRTPHLADATRSFRIEELPLGERDLSRLRQQLPETTRAVNGRRPQVYEAESVMSRYLRYWDEALMSGFDEDDAIERAANLIEEDILRARGVNLDRPRRGWAGRQASRIGQFWRGVAGAILYRPTTLIRRLIEDTVSETALIALDGKATALGLANDPNLIRQAVAAQRDPATARRLFRESDAGRIVSDLGIGQRWRSGVSMGSLGYDRASGLRVRAVDSAAMARRQRAILGTDPAIPERAKNKIWDMWNGAPRAIINGTSEARRIGVYADHIRQNLPRVWKQVRDDAIDRTGRWGFVADDEMVSDVFNRLFDRMRQEQRWGFDALQLRDELYRAAREQLDGAGQLTVAADGSAYRWADNQARHYQDLLSALDDEALKSVQDTLFSYLPTRADEYIGKVFWFHYWTTRASVSYGRHILTNPALLSAYIKTVEGLQNAAEQGNYPPVVKGFIRVLNSDAGYGMYLNPVAMFATYLTFRQNGDNGGDDNALERFLRQYSPGMLHPMIEAGLNWFGAMPNSLPYDPLNTWIERRLFGGAVNWAVAHGWLPGDGLLDAPYQDFLGWIRSKASALGHKIAPGIFTELPQTASAQATNQRQLNDLIMTVAQERFPNDPERAYVEAAAALYDPDSGIYQEAFRRYTDMVMIGAIAATIIPGAPRMRTTNADQNAVYRDETRAARPALTSRELAITDPAYDQAQFENQLILSATPEEARLRIGDRAYDRAGTPEERAAYDEWTTIAFGSPEELAADYPGGITIAAPTGTYHYTPTDLASFSQDDRFIVADAYMESTGRSEAIASIRQRRQELVGSSVDLAQYDAFQNMITDQSEAAGLSPIAWADATSAANPNYRRWWAEQRSQIEQRTTPGSDRDSQLEAAVFSVDSYLAYQGQPVGIYGSQPTDVRDSGAVPAGAGDIWASQGLIAPTGGGGGGASNDGFDAITLERQRAEYEQQVAQANSVLYDIAGAPVDYRDLNPLALAAFENIMAQRGLQMPQPGWLLSLYMEWVANQPPGADISYDAFFRAQQQLNGQDALLTLPAVGAGVP